MTWASDIEVHEFIGRFCVDFEQVCRSMETCIRTILHGQGLTNEPIQEILLSGHTAEPLRALLQSLVGQTLAKTDEENKICSKVFGRLQELINERNDLMHSKWYFVGLKNEEGWQEILALGEKLHANKQGVATKSFNLEKQKLETLVKQCRGASIMVSLLTRCVMGVRSLGECFQVQGNQLSVKYDALRPVQRNV